MGCVAITSQLNVNFALNNQFGGFCAWEMDDDGASLIISTNWAHWPFCFVFVVIFVIRFFGFVLNLAAYAHEHSTMTTKTTETTKQQISNAFASFAFHADYLLENASRRFSALMTCNNLAVEDGTLRLRRRHRHRNIVDIMRSKRVQYVRVCERAYVAYDFIATRNSSDLFIISFCQNLRRFPRLLCVCVWMWLARQRRCQRQRDDDEVATAQSPPPPPAAASPMPGPMCVEI